MKFFKFREKPSPDIMPENKLKPGVYFSTDDDEYSELESPYMRPKPISRQTKTKDSDDCYLFI